MVTLMELTVVNQWHIIAETGPRGAGRESASGAAETISSRPSQSRETTMLCSDSCGDWSCMFVKLNVPVDPPDPDYVRPATYCPHHPYWVKSRKSDTTGINVFRRKHKK